MDGEDHQVAWARQEQEVRTGSLVANVSVDLARLILQQIMREQDQTIDSLVGTLSTLAQQAGLMGQEIVEHNE